MTIPPVTISNEAPIGNVLELLIIVNVRCFDIIHINWPISTQILIGNIESDDTIIDKSDILILGCVNEPADFI